MKLRVSIGLMVVLCSGACTASKKADFLSATHDGLAISQVTYKKVLEGFAEAQIQGQITDAQMENVLRIGKAYQNTHNLILTLLIEYIELTDPIAKASLQSRVNSLSFSLHKIAIEFITMLSTYGVRVAT